MCNNDCLACKIRTRIRFTRLFLLLRLQIRIFFNCLRSIGFVLTTLVYYHRNHLLYHIHFDRFTSKYLIKSLLVIRPVFSRTVYLLFMDITRIILTSKRGAETNHPFSHRRRPLRVPIEQTRERGGLTLFDDIIVSWRNTRERALCHGQMSPSYPLPP